MSNESENVSTDKTIDHLQGPDDEMTYKEYGFAQSHRHGASDISLEVELHKIHETYKDKLRKDEEAQQKMKEPVRSRLEGLRIELEQLEDQLALAQTQTIPGIRAKIDALKEEISRIRLNPTEFQEHRPNRISYIIGIIVLAILTVYLWIFYTSSGYSAFFRKFEPDDINVADSIFDAQAIVKAWYQGVPAFVLVCSMPFIFLALGYLMHKLMGEKGAGKWVRLTLLLFVTFCFDYIIAYEIVSKIHELKKAASMEVLPPYGFSEAIKDMSFWLIIFAGFVTYLIWGLLFDRIMEEFERFDGLGHQIRIRQAELAALGVQLQAEEAKPARILEDITAIRKEIKSAESDLSAVFMNPKDFEHIVYAFTSGWMQFIEGGQMSSPEFKDALRIKCKQVAHDFISTHNNRIIHEEVK